MNSAVRGISHIVWYIRAEANPSEKEASKHTRDVVGRSVSVARGQLLCQMPCTRLLPARVAQRLKEGSRRRSAGGEKVNMLLKPNFILSSILSRASRLFSYIIITVQVKNFSMVNVVSLAWLLSKHGIPRALSEPSLNESLFLPRVPFEKMPRLCAIAGHIVMGLQGWPSAPLPPTLVCTSHLYASFIIILRCILAQSSSVQNCSPPSVPESRLLHSDVWMRWPGSASKCRDGT
jgi:hypothetical protein